MVGGSGFIGGYRIGARSEIPSPRGVCDYPVAEAADFRLTLGKRFQDGWIQSGEEITQIDLLSQLTFQTRKGYQGQLGKRIRGEDFRNEDGTPARMGRLQKPSQMLAANRADYLRKTRVIWADEVGRHLDQLAEEAN